MCAFLITSAHKNTTKYWNVFWLLLMNSSDHGINHGLLIQQPLVNGPINHGILYIIRWMEDQV